MLCTRIAEVQDGSLMVMSRNPTPRVQEIDDDQWRHNARARADAQPSMFTAINGMPESGPAYAQAQASFMSLFDKDGAAPAMGNGGPVPMSPQRQNTGRQIWDQSNHMGPGAHDLIDQLQTFDGSFNTVESNGTLDMLFANGALWDNVTSDDWMASVQNNPGVFNSPTQPPENLQRTYE